MRFLRREPVPDGLRMGRGEKVLAQARAQDGTALVATRDALYLVPANAPVRRVAWEQVETAHWDGETSVFQLSEVGQWGEERPVHVFVLDGARVFLELVHERVNASIVLQRHVTVPGGGLRVIARRAPHGENQILWIFEYDEMVDPDDPAVRSAAEQALALAKADVGLG